MAYQRSADCLSDNIRGSIAQYGLCQQTAIHSSDFFSPGPHSFFILLLSFSYTSVFTFLFFLSLPLFPSKIASSKPPPIDGGAKRYACYIYQPLQEFKTLKLE